VVLRPNHQTAVSIARPPRPGYVTRQSSIKPATRPAPPRHRVSAYPRCQPPWLIIRLLRSVNQDPTFVLHRSRSINTNSHDLHLSHRPSSMYSTPAHHKRTDVVAHTYNSHYGQSTDYPECYPLTSTHYQSEQQETSPPCVRKYNRKKHQHVLFISISSSGCHL
jgi:hypothetical protein